MHDGVLLWAWHGGRLRGLREGLRGLRGDGAMDSAQSRRPDVAYPLLVREGRGTF